MAGIRGPHIKIDVYQLESLMRLKPTLDDTAAFFKCNPRTIERFIRDNFDLTFVEFRDQNMVHTRLSLVREAIKQAQSGNTAMLIFCLKNVCHWADKVEVNNGHQTIELKYSVEKKNNKKDVIDVEATDGQKQIAGKTGDAGGKTKKGE